MQEPHIIVKDNGAVDAHGTMGPGTPIYDERGRKIAEVISFFGAGDHYTIEIRKLEEPK